MSSVKNLILEAKYRVNRFEFGRSKGLDCKILSFLEWKYILSLATVSTNFWNSMQNLSWFKTIEDVADIAV